MDNLIFNYVAEYEAERMAPSPLSGMTNPDELAILAPAGRALPHGWAMGMDTRSVAT